MPQLGLQHTMPTLQVDKPHVSLKGITGGLSHGLGSQRWPGRTQVPQLELQQSSPTLHVFAPHCTLSTNGDMPQTN
jgi:hypothetical protein